MHGPQCGVLELVLSGRVGALFVLLAACEDHGGHGGVDDAAGSSETQYALLTVTTSGAGTVTSSPAGIECGSACEQAYAVGEVVTLTAAPDASSIFTGWSGACSGAGTCSVSMDAPQTVTATFAVKQVTLTVTRTGDGDGTVTGAGIDCAPGCTVTLDYGATIALTAVPSAADATASKLTGWSGGGCAGSAGCSVTLTADTVVSAGFKLLPNVMFVTSTVHSGNLGGLAGADTICNSLAASSDRPGNYVAYLSSLNGATAISAPSRVGTASGWTRTDGLPVINAITELAGGMLMNAPSVTDTGDDVAQVGAQNVWTGTSSSGVYANACTPSGSFVAWGGTSGSANVGLLTSTTSAAVAATTSSCAASLRLYCFGIDRAASVP
jgi:hypothetical protein